MVWGVMSYRALSHLHIIPKGQTVTSEYYVEVILKQSLASTMLRTGDSGTILERELLPERSKAIFQQDGAPAHTSKRSQEWLKSNMPGFWTKDIWPPNSPDLNPIENLWAILKSKLGQWNVNQHKYARKTVTFGLERNLTGYSRETHRRDSLSH